MKLFDVNIKIFSVAAFAIIMLLSFPENSYSQESGEEVENQGLALLDGAIDGIPWYSMLFPGSMAAILCDIRRFLSGEVTMVIVATAIFIIGLMVLTNRINWGYIVLVIICSFILTNPEYLTRAIMGPVFGQLTRLCLCVDLNYQVQDGGNPELDMELGCGVN